MNMTGCVSLLYDLFVKFLNESIKIGIIISYSSNITITIQFD